MRSRYVWLVVGIVGPLFAADDQQGVCSSAMCAKHQRLYTDALHRIEVLRSQLQSAQWRCKCREAELENAQLKRELDEVEREEVRVHSPKVLRRSSLPSIELQLHTALRGCRCRKPQLPTVQPQKPKGQAKRAVPFKAKRSSLPSIQTIFQGNSDGNT